MAKLPLTGGCNCGAVRYEVTEPLRAFVADAAPWEAIPDDGLPRYPQSRHAKP